MELVLADPLPAAEASSSDAVAARRPSVSLQSLMEPAFKVACRQVDGGKYGLEAAAHGTEIMVTGPDVAGLLSRLTGQLFQRGYDIHSTKGEILPVGNKRAPAVRDTFVVTRFGSSIEAKEEALLCSALASVADDLYRTASQQVETVVQYSVTVSNDEVAGASVLYVVGPDCAGLLGAITSTLSAASCSIMSFGGETLTVGDVRDRFVISVDGAPLNEGKSAPLIRRLQEACRKVAMPEEVSVPHHFDVQVMSCLTDTRIVIEGPDTPGLLSKLSSALASDGYEVVGFEAGSGQEGGGLEGGGLEGGVREGVPTANAADMNLDRVHDVFRVTRNGQPLSEDEAKALQGWITQVCDSAYHESTRLNRSNNSKESFSSKRSDHSKEADGRLLHAAKRSKEARTLTSSQRRGGGRAAAIGRLFGCLPHANSLDADATDSKSSSEGYQEMSALERQGLIAALKHKGEALAAAADTLMHRQSVTDNEMAVLQAQLGEGHLSDLMKRAQIDPAAVECGDVIGVGAFGEVRAGSLHGTPVAIKTIHRHLVATGGLEQFKAECELCLTLRHPNIVQLIGACWAMDAPIVFLVMERCQGTLSDALLDAGAGRRHDFELAAARLPCVLGVARAMAYLHTQRPPILHRDLKPDNVLLSGDRQAKVSDFGSSRDVAKMAITQVGTPLFSAPEVMAHEPYDGAADVWSFGCVLSCVYRCAVEPYARDDLRAEGMHAVMRRVITGSLPPCHTEGTPLGDIGAQCNQLPPQQRPSFLALVEMLQAESVTAWARAEDERAAAIAKTGQPGGPGRRGSAGAAPAATVSHQAANKSRRGGFGLMVRSRGERVKG